MARLCAYNAVSVYAVCDQGKARAMINVGHILQYILEHNQTDTTAHQKVNTQA